MKRILVLFIVLAFAHIATAQNLLTTNPGFDDGPAVSISLTDQSDATSIPGWVAVAVNGKSASYEVKEEATAPSAPNVLEFSSTDAQTYSTVLQAALPRVSITPGTPYKYSFYARAMDAGSTSISSIMSIHENGAFRENIITNHPLSSDWQKFEVVFTPKSDQNENHIWIVSELPSFNYQIDSVEMEDITTDNRILNGGFELSGTQPLHWTLVGGGATDRGFQAALTNDAFEGSRALAVSTTSADGGDAAIQGDQVSWAGSNEVILTFRAKDLDAIATDERIWVVLDAFDVNGGWLGNIISEQVDPGSGAWDYYEFSAPMPANSVRAAVSFRIKDSAGVLDGAGDLIIDDVRLGDLTVGTTVPVVLSTFSIDIYE